MGRVKEKVKYVTTKDFIRIFAKNSGYGIADITSLYGAMEKSILQALDQATEDTPVYLKLTRHIVLIGYCHDNNGLCNLPGKSVVGDDKYKIKVSQMGLARDFKNKKLRENVD